MQHLESLIYEVESLRERVAKLEDQASMSMPIGPIKRVTERPDPKVVERLLKGVLEEQQQRAAKENP